MVFLDLILQRARSSSTEFTHRSPGTICMDMCMIDVTHVPYVRLGDEVTIMGKDGIYEITADDIARETAPSTMKWSAASVKDFRRCMCIKCKRGSVHRRSLLPRFHLTLKVLVL